MQILEIVKNIFFMYRSPKKWAAQKFTALQRRDLPEKRKEKNHVNEETQIINKKERDIDTEK